MYSLPGFLWDLTEDTSIGGRVFFCALITTAHPAPAPYLWLPVAKVPFCDASSEGHKLGINAAQVKNLKCCSHYEKYNGSLSNFKFKLKSQPDLAITLWAEE